MVVKKFLKAICVGVTVAASVVTVVGQSGTHGSNSAGRAAGTNDGQQVIAETDRFSGVTNITLKPQKIVETAERFLTVSAESKVGGQPSIDYEEADERVLLDFDLQTTGAASYELEDLSFLVDGKSVTGGSVASSFSPLLGVKPTSPYTKRRTFTGSVSISTLRQLVRGKHVEIRLGSIEAALSPALLNKLGQFVLLYEQAKGKTQP